MPPGHFGETGQGGKRAGKGGDQQQHRSADQELQGGRSERAGDRLAELGVGARLNRQKAAGEKGKRDKNCFHETLLWSGILELFLAPSVTWARKRSFAASSC